MDDLSSVKASCGDPKVDVAAVRVDEDGAPSRSSGAIKPASSLSSKDGALLESDEAGVGAAAGAGEATGKRNFENEGLLANASAYPDGEWAVGAVRTL